VKHPYCSIFGHSYVVTKKVTLHVKEYTCKNCHEEFTTNGNGKLTLLTPKYKEINSVLERVYLKRLKRKNLKLDH
jgi:transposase-like protein